MECPFRHPCREDEQINGQTEGYTWSWRGELQGGVANKLGEKEVLLYESKF
jgi:hypothetical protein